MSTITVRDDLPDPNQDCIALRKATEDVRCNKRLLMDVICHRNQQQRSRIRDTYVGKHEEDLLQCLRRKLSGCFQLAVVLWMCNPSERDAKIINSALMGWMKDLAAVTEIIYFCTSSEVASIGLAYRSTFQRSLEEDVGLKTSGDEKAFLLALVRQERPDVLEPDRSLAEADAKDLLLAVSNRRAIDKGAIIKIMSSRSPLQMRATIDHYKQAYRHSLGKVIKQETKGGFQALLRVAMKCAKNPVNYFSKALYTSMKGLGTDNSTLIRVVAMRAEIDMKDIKAHFDRKYEKSLKEMIISDTSGSYRSFLLFLIGASLSEVQSASSLSHFLNSGRRY